MSLGTQGNVGPLTSIGLGLSEGLELRREREESEAERQFKREKLAQEQEQFLLTDLSKEKREQQKFEREDVREQAKFEREQASVIPELEEIAQFQKTVNELAATDPNQANAFITNFEQSDSGQRLKSKLNAEGISMFVTPEKEQVVKGKGNITKKNKAFIEGLAEQILGFKPELNIGDPYEFTDGPDEKIFNTGGQLLKSGRFTFNPKIGLFDTATGDITRPISDLQSIMAATGAKDLNEARAKAQDFATRIQSGLEVFQEFIDAGKSLTKGKVVGTLGRADIKRRKQAEKLIALAILRKESGATIGEKEEDNAFSMFIPSAFDQRSVIRQKLKSVQLIMNNFKKAAGDPSLFTPFELRFPEEEGLKEEEKTQPFEVIRDSEGNIIGKKRV